MKLPQEFESSATLNTPTFRAGPYTTTYPEDLGHQLRVAMDTLHVEFANFNGMGSGWVLDHVHHLQLGIAEYQPFTGSSYIPLQRKIQNKHAVVNVKNEDPYCFKWAVLAALHPVSHNPQRLTHYLRYRDELDFTGVEFPVSAEGIKRFEKNNPSISITVVGYEENKKNDGELFPHYVAKKKRTHHIVLLLWSKGEKTHYAWIKNFNRFMFSQNNHKAQMFFCERCFHGFTRSELLSNHEDLCQDRPIQRTLTTKEGVYFKNTHKSELLPYIIYADFECILPKETQSSFGKTQWGVSLTSLGNLMTHMVCPNKV